MNKITYSAATPKFGGLLLIVFISLTSFRLLLHGAFNIVALTGISSIGLMTLVNFMINYDFKWILFAFMLPWLIAIILYRLHN